jgi:hypothetical protein
MSVEVIAKALDAVSARDAKAFFENASSRIVDATKQSTYCDNNTL